MTVIINADFGNMAQAIGVISGIAKGSKVYTSALVEMAEEAAEKEFNISADAFTMSTGQLRHVYEPGKNGLPGYRLWTIRASTGAGGRRSGKRSVSFTFKSSKLKSPNTPESTGIPEGVFPAGLRNKSRVPFFNRAFVLETGQTVTLRPKYSKVLFIPLWQEVPLPGRNKAEPQVDEHGRERWFRFSTKPTTFTPSKFAGNFSSFWATWWETEGPAVVKRTTEKRAYGDIRRLTKKGFTSKQARSRSIEITVKRNEKVAEALMENEAEQMRRLLDG